MRTILLFNRRKLDGKAPVEYEVYFTRYDRVWISTRIRIEAKFWDEKAQAVSTRHQDHLALNEKIRALGSRIAEIEARYQASGETLTGEILKAKLNEIPEAVTFNEYLDRQIEIDRPTIKYSTFRRIKSVVTNFHRFRTVYFSECDVKMIREYHNYLLKSMQQTTTPKNHKTISKYLKRAVQEGLLKQNPYIHFKIPAYATRRIFLTGAEIKKIRETVIEKERYQITRDMFLMMCNTGMEYADLINLSVDDITTIESKKYIVKSRMKVEGEIQAIPLFPEALEIIERHSTGTGFVFPRKSNQRLNDNLADLARLCDIEKPLSTIVARHTFATMMLTKGMPLESVSHILGHSNTKTTRIYAKLIISKIDNDLSRLGIDGV